VRFFVFDGIRKEAPSAELVSADPVTAGCRMIKSPSRPGDFHPEALTDPDVNLSVHPARATA
jgi:hypothetical protein